MCAVLQRAGFIFCHGAGVKGFVTGWWGSIERKACLLLSERRLCLCGEGRGVLIHETLDGEYFKAGLAPCTKYK